MKRLLIWFSIIYGQLNGIALLIVFVAYWVESESGQKACLKVNLTQVACQSWLTVIVVICLGYTMVVSIKRFMVEKRKTLQNDKSPSDESP